MTMTFNNRKTGVVSDNSVPVNETLERLYGAGDIHAMFPEGTADKRPSPWPQAGRSKHVKDYDQDLVTNELRGKPNLVDIDPRMLHSTQPSIHRPGVQHYLGDDYKRTGETYGDKGNLGNQWPLVYSRQNPTGPTQHIILAGHHRAGAALLKGEPLRARHVEGGYGGPRR